MPSLEITLLNTKIIPRTRANNRSYASYHSKPKLHIFIKDWNVLEDLQGGRWNKPHNAFKQQVLSDALKQAGLNPEIITATWNQKAGCSCGCSPGFILSSIDKNNPDLPPIDVYCDYEVEVIE